ncbi:MAG: helix-turn-helix transcriptional regulator [Desulfotomaculum sp.]|nr:helix-turn-helix transcriptional regulator [Desulfotomaculum sp.]
MPLYDKKQIGANIKKARMNKSAQLGFGYTRKLLADAMEEPAHIITKLEAGEYYPDYEHIKKISEICGVSIKFLVGEEFESMESYFQAIRAATKNQKKNPPRKHCIDSDFY